MTPFLILYAGVGLVFTAVALWWTLGPSCNEPWPKSLAWSVLVGVFWPIALAMAVYELAHTRWI